MTEYTKTDTIDSIDAEQLELIASSDSSWLLSYIEDKTIFDVNRIRLMLDLGAVEAKRRVELKRSNVKLRGAQND